MDYNEEMIHGIVSRQRDFFRKGMTLDVDWRLRQLKILKDAVLRHQDEILEAVQKDLGKHPVETYFCEIGSFVLEINGIMKGLKKWSKTEIHFSGLHCFPSLMTKVWRMPYGVTLVISPFNFPILLSLGVLAASLAGGNTAVVKVSSKSMNSSRLLNSIVAECFPPEYVAVIEGGHDVADMCLNERFDKIFYTGSPKIGKHVMECASKNLTPVALELGGETGNWCIVRKDADIKDAARKIAFFKILNAGQICIDVNQVAVASEIALPFVEELKKAFEKQIGEDALANAEYPRLISSAAYAKCAGVAEKYRDRIVYGGYGDEETLRYAPTIVYPVDADEDIVQHELFSPVLPVVVFNDKEVDALIEKIEGREHGLALYIFTKDVKWAEKTMKTLQFGGGCINEVCLHMMVKGVPFNGTGHSGMGAYHGRYGYEEFTHPCTLTIGSNHMNMPLREHPYAKWKLALIKVFER